MLPRQVSTLQDRLVFVCYYRNVSIWLSQAEMEGANPRQDTGLDNHGNKKTNQATSSSFKD
jgi:hypothetical protein